MSDALTGAGISSICAAFDLGEPSGDVTPVAGGLTHRMLRLATSRGVFAVKLINRDWGNPDYVPWYERAFKVELAAFAAGIAMPRPVPVAWTGACLAEIADGARSPIMARVHEWVEGAPLTHESASASDAREVGAIVAAIHALAIAPTGNAEHLSSALDRVHWGNLLERGRAGGTAWSGALEAALPIVDGLIAFVQSATPDVRSMIMSHRDSDAKNVLRAKDGRLLLIDWDAASPVVARRDVATHALVWGGGYAGEPNPALARAFVAGYRGAGGVYDNPRADDFAEFLRVMLYWCEFNLRRTLGERLASESHRKIAEAEVRHLLAAFPRFAHSSAAWAKMLA